MDCCCRGELVAKDVNPKLRAPPVCCVVLGLTALFCLTSGLLSFHTSLLAVFLIFLGAVLLMMWFSGWSNHPSFRLLCLMSASSLILGAAIGTANYRANWSLVQTAAAGRKYTDLAPGAKASAHADAGSVKFHGATLDTSSGFGLQRGIFTYCVAPIMDESMSPAHGVEAKAVQFWAVGVDCCRRRRDFQCGDAHLADVQGGIVVPEPDIGPWGASPITASILAPRTNWGGYMDAVEAASALYGLATAKPPVFVIWQKDPEELLEQASSRTLLLWGVATAVHLALVFPAWMMAHFYYSAELRFAMGVSDDAAEAGGADMGLATPGTGARKRFNDPFLLSPGNPL